MSAMNGQAPGIEVHQVVVLKLVTLPSGQQTVTAEFSCDPLLAAQMTMGGGQAILQQMAKAKQAEAARKGGEGSIEVPNEQLRDALLKPGSDAEIRKLTNPPENPAA